MNTGARTHELVTSTLMLFIGVGVLIAATSIESGSATLPRLIGIGVVATAILNAIESPATMRRSRAIKLSEVILFGLMIGSVLLIRVLGFYSSCALFCVGTLLYVNRPVTVRRIAVAVAFSVGLVTTLYVVLRLVLRLSTPQGFLI